MTPSSGKAPPQKPFPCCRVSMYTTRLRSHADHGAALQEIKDWDSWFTQQTLEVQEAQLIWGPPVLKQGQQVLCRPVTESPFPGSTAAVLQECHTC